MAFQRKTRRRVGFLLMYNAVNPIRTLKKESLMPKFQESTVFDATGLITILKDTLPKEKYKIDYEPVSDMFPNQDTVYAVIIQRRITDWTLFNVAKLEMIQNINLHLSFFTGVSRMDTLLIEKALKNLQ